MNEQPFDLVIVQIDNRIFRLTCSEYRKCCGFPNGTVLEFRKRSEDNMFLHAYTRIKINENTGKWEKTNIDEIDLMLKDLQFYGEMKNE